MTELDPLQEMQMIHNNLIKAARESKKGFDDRMRITVKVLLAYRYPIENKPDEVTREIESWKQAMEAIDVLTDSIFGVDSSGQRQFMRNNYEWNRNRPARIFDYIQKLVDIIPAGYLIRLVRDSQHLSADEFIAKYEAVKGEAKNNDYCGYPTGVDLR